MRPKKCIECGEWFVPIRQLQRYCNKRGKRTCKNRAAQRRLRDRYRTQRSKDGLPK